MKKQSSYRQIYEEDVDDNRRRGSGESGRESVRRASSWNSGDMLPHGDEQGHVDVYGDDGEDRRAALSPGRVQGGIMGRIRGREAAFQRVASHDEADYDTQDWDASNVRSNPDTAGSVVETEEDGDMGDSEQNLTKRSNLPRNNDDDDDDEGPPENPFRLNFDIDGSGLDDYDDDDEDEVARYAFDFSHDGPGGGGSGSIFYANANDEHAFQSAVPHGSDLRPFQGSPLEQQQQRQSTTCCKLRVQRIVEKIRAARAESRRKRMERLLALPDEDGYSSKCHYCATQIMMCLSSSWCDLTDRGLLVILAAIAFFVLVYRILDLEKDEQARKLLLRIGVPAILFRVGWRPLYWFVWGRRVARRRKTTLELYDGLNGEHGTKGLRIPYMDDMEMEPTSDRHPELEQDCDIRVE